MLSDSAVTIGAAASKKCRLSPRSSSIAVSSLPSVSGPVAMTVGPSGMLVTSSVTTSILGFDRIASVTAFENSSLSTASAPPAGTLVASAQRIMIEPRQRSSCLSSPTALSSLSERRELEQTSSANPSLLCAGERREGFISKSLTPIPLSASTAAHSQPASPAPITLTCIDAPYFAYSADSFLLRRTNLQSLFEHRVYMPFGPILRTRRCPHFGQTSLVGRSHET